MSNTQTVNVNITLSVPSNYGTRGIPVTPTVPISATYTYTVNNLEVQFDSTVIDPSGNIEDVVYEWDFGDSNTSSEDDPLHTYTLTTGEETKTFPTKLKVIDPVTGSYATPIIDVTVTSEVVTPPHATYTTTPTYESVQFTSTVTDPDGDLEDIIYAWDFGDGNTSSDANPLHVYTISSGVSESFTTSLTVTDPATGTYTTPDSIVTVAKEFITPPSATFSSSVNLLEVTFTSSVTNPDGDVSDVIYEWDFGDGNTSSESNPVHSYTLGEGVTSETFQVTLKVSDPITGEYTTPVSSVTVTSSTSDIPLSVSVTENLVECTNPISEGVTVEGVWDFNDGTEDVITEDPSHEYFIHGEYDITFEDSESITTVPTVVVERDIPTVLYTYVVGNPDSQHYVFTATGGESYKWYIDGSLVTETTNTLTYDFTTVGYTTVTCIGTDSYNNADYNEQSFIVLSPNTPPSATFTYIKDKLNVQFTSTVTDDDGDIEDIIYEWNFGDGTYSSDANPLHVYTITSGEESQTFEVTLKVTDDRGGSYTTNPDSITVSTAQAYGDELIVNSDMSGTDISHYVGSTYSDVSLSDGWLKVEATAGTQNWMYIDLPDLVVGTQYELSINYYCEVYTNQAIKNLVGFENSSLWLPLSSTTPVDLVTQLVGAESDEYKLRFYNGSGVVLFSSISLREVI